MMEASSSGREADHDNRSWTKDTPSIAFLQRLFLVIERT
jgi:hypothetical protein